MKKNKSIEIVDILRPTVVFSLIVLTVGIVVAVISTEVAWLLIGISIALLGAFQLFTNIISILNDLKATKVSQKNFGNSSKENIVNESQNEIKTDDNVYQDDVEEDEFRIVAKTKKEEIKKEEKTVFDEPEEDISDVRIVRKIEHNNNGNHVSSEPHLKQEVKKTAQENSSKEKVISKPVEDKKINIENKNYKNIEISMESIRELLKSDYNVNLKPKEDLEYMLSKLLMILSSITETKTAIFAVTDDEHINYIIESFVTAVPDKISKDTNFKVKNDLISQVIKTGKPVIINEINADAENDLIKYYSEKTGTKSFLGTPVFYEDKVLGVLCVDSNSNEAYDESIVNLIKDFTNLGSSFISNYHTKYNLFQEQKALLAIEKFTHIIQQNEDTQDNIIDALIEAVSMVYDFERVGICGYNESEDSWNIIALKNDKNEELGAKAEMQNSYISRTLTKYEPYYDRINSDTGIRVHPNEPQFDKGFFIAIPLKSKTNNFGAFFAECNKEGRLNESDITALMRISEFAALSIERINMNDILRTATMIDQNSGLYNHSAFYHRMKEEIIRAKDFKYNISLVLIKIDKYDTYEQYPEKMEKITVNVIRSIEKNLRVYDILGKADQDIFGVILIETDTSKAQFWSEKLRNEIANTMLDINSQKFSVTVSIGVSQLSKEGESADLINHALEALNQSLNKTNSVTIF